MVIAVMHMALALAVDEIVWIPRVQIEHMSGTGVETGQETEGQEGGRHHLSGEGQLTSLLPLYLHLNRYHVQFTDGFKQSSLTSIRFSFSETLNYIEEWSYNGTIKTSFIDTFYLQDFTLAPKGKLQRQFRKRALSTNKKRAYQRGARQ